MIKVICGVDPGNSGALSLLSKKAGELKVLELVSMPTYRQLIKPARVWRGKKHKAKYGPPRIDELKVKEILLRWQKVYGMELVILERQQKNQTRGGETVTGSVATGTTMEQYGLLRGICTGIGLPYQEFTPANWHKLYKDYDVPILEYLHQFKLEDPKKWSLSMAHYFFPDTSLLRTPKCEKPSDAFSDALLIANSYWLLEDMQRQAA